MASTPPGPLARTNHLSWPPGSYQADADPNNPAFNPASVLASSGVVTDGNAALDTEHYHRPLERLHGSGMHGPGVAFGLQVSCTIGQPNVLADGHGAVPLTSANETVSKVSVIASALDQPYAPGFLDLEFV